MNTSPPQLTAAPRLSATPRPDASLRQGSSLPNGLTRGEALLETGPLIGAPAFYGPPIIVVLGPWLLLVLMLIGPFVLFLTILLALALAVGLLAVLAGVIASPYLLVRRLRAHAMVRAESRAAHHLSAKHRATAVPETTGQGFGELDIASHRAVGLEYRHASPNLSLSLRATLPASESLRVDAAPTGGFTRHAPGREQVRAAQR